MTGRSNKTVNRIIQAYRKEGRISDAPHRRHPRATTAAQDADILDAAKASPFSTAREIGAAAGVSASASTIKRRLVESKLKSHVAAQKPRLSLSNKTARLNFATEHVSYHGRLENSTFFGRIYVHNALGPKATCVAPCQFPLRPPLRARSSIERTHGC
ncbi:hypothetical protein HPB52_018134 [Rhipicephalus sanguineus]|uniref:Transposase Tc1-like domain-containing protein n=1 Tax=Rhipicephalus sanguineus TaxID=34632 RepID=A0A9D4TB72_RHISA|nr:hypothetical protein HPB52_018134 [Rhipicephalus sanguineus]